jgi:hypothetical protein
MFATERSPFWIFYKFIFCSLFHAGRFILCSITE